MTSQSAYCLSRENRILDETNDKQQISLGNFKLIRPLESLLVQNKCFEKVWRDDDVTVSLLSLVSHVKIGSWTKKQTINNRYYSVIFNL